MDSVAVYNDIQDVQSQYAKLETSRIESLQDSLYDIFRDHHAQHDFGLALVHRHYELPPGHIMVHSQDEEGKDLCRAEALGKRDVYPRSYHIHQGEFVPYEYSSDPIPSPAATFLSEMATFLRHHEQQNTIGITHISHGKSCWLETMSHSHKGTIAIPMSTEVKSVSCGFVVTEWAFLDTDGGSRMIPSRVCKELDNGGHKVTD